MDIIGDREDIATHRSRYLPGLEVDTRRCSDYELDNARVAFKCLHTVAQGMD